MDGRLIAVNNHYETNIPGIFAIGDLVGGFQLAHSASAEGIHTVDFILGKYPRAINQNRNTTLRVYTSGNRNIWHVRA